MARLVDLSHPIVEGMVTYPGLPVPRYATVLSREASRGRYAEGVEFHIGTVELCGNTGTYLDTPFHRFADGHDLAALPLERCVDLPAVVLRTEGRPLDADALDGVEVAGAAVLVHTGWDERWGTDAYLDRSNPYVTPAAVQVLVDGGAALVGIDSLNIDSTEGGDRTAHSELLRVGTPIVEHLTRLAGVPERGARFSAVPAPFVGLGTFPVRAFASVP